MTTNRTLITFVVTNMIEEVLRCHLLGVRSASKESCQSRVGK